MSNKQKKQARALLDLMERRPEIRALLDKAQASSTQQVRQMVSGDGGLRDILVRATAALKIEQGKTAQFRREAAERGMVGRDWVVAELDKLRAEIDQLRPVPSAD